MMKIANHPEDVRPGMIKPRISFYDPKDIIFHCLKSECSRTMKKNTELPGLLICPNCSSVHELSLVKSNTPQLCSDFQLVKLI